MSIKNLDATTHTNTHANKRQYTALRWKRFFVIWSITVAVFVIASPGVLVVTCDGL